MAWVEPQETGLSGEPILIMTLLLAFKLAVAANQQPWHIV